MMLDALLGRRMKPSLVIIGAQKAGTTTLFDILAQHPQVRAPQRKEISFFSKDHEYAKGIDHYWAEFPRYPRALGRFITLDASPMYLYHEQAPERIAKHLPDALCLAILRDPVDRAYSAWNMYRTFKDHPVHGHLYDPRSFEQAVEEELAGKRDIPGRRYVERGVYMPQLMRYERSIMKGNLFVKDFRTLRSGPAMIVNEALIRLGLDPIRDRDPSLGRQSNARNYESPISLDLAGRLRAHYAEDAALVEAHFGVQISADW